MLVVGGLARKLEARSATMLLEASDRLFTASATIDTEPAARPTAPFAMQRTTLQTMLTMPANCP
jgi:hypothetical protein